MCVRIKARVEHGRQQAGRDGDRSLCLAQGSKGLPALKWSDYSILVPSCPETFQLLLFIRFTVGQRSIALLDA